MAWPIETRSDRLASGSALVESNIIPSQPSATALRTIEPMLIGLSTASTAIKRVAHVAELLGCGTCRSGEEGDDALRHAELGDHRPYLIAAGVDRDVVGEPSGDRWWPGSIDQGNHGGAPGVESALDDEIALGHEQAVAVVAAPLPATGQSTLVAPEARQPGIVGIVDHDQVGRVHDHVSSATGTRSSRARACRRTRSGPPRPRRWHRPGEWPRRRTPADRPARRRSG